jgi:hypothetical protein
MMDEGEVVKRVVTLRVGVPVIERGAEEGRVRPREQP